VVCPEASRLSEGSPQAGFRLLVVVANVVVVSGDWVVTVVVGLPAPQVEE
jgi:hypothetical protein